MICADSCERLLSALVDALQHELVLSESFTRGMGGWGTTRNLHEKEHHVSYGV